MTQIVNTSPWTDLALEDLQQLIVWLDYAEHHAMREYSIASPAHEADRRRGWDTEARKLARVQAEIRQIWESRTGRPLSRIDRS